jgi:carboxylesterase
MDPEKTAAFELGRGPDAVLLLHGFTGSPWDVRPLAEALAEHDYYIRAIRLPGHGLTPEAMLEVSWRDWEHAALDALAGLSEYRHVFVAGLSMGALLAMLLAAQRPERVQALALLAPAVRFRGRTRLLLHTFRHFPFLRVVQPWILKDGSDIADPNARGEAPVLRAWPSARVDDLWTVRERALSQAHRVRAPALVAVATDDHVVSPYGGEELVRRMIASPGVRFVQLDDGFHIIPRDLGRQRLAREVRAFFDRARG